MPQEIETVLADGISHFAQNYLGRRPERISTHLRGDILVVRLQGVLSSAEQEIAKRLSAEKGRDLLKRMRAELIEATRAALEALVEKTTGSKVVSLHHDISTVSGEQLVVFTLAEAPAALGEPKPT
jgi:uncharacterized protein YbcI